LGQVLANVVARCAAPRRADRRTEDEAQRNPQPDVISRGPKDHAQRYSRPMNFLSIA
jgi:hypothetical protein